MRLHLPMQGAEVQSLVGEDPTYHRATKPVRCTTEAHAPRACAVQQEKPSKVEKAYAKQQRSSTTKKYNFKINKNIINIKLYSRAH